MKTLNTFFQNSALASWILFIAWFILPVANYSQEQLTLGNYFWIMGVGLPFFFYLTKASLASCISLIWLFYRGGLRSIQWHWVDVCCVVFVISPILSVLHENNEGWKSLLDSVYLFIVWGVPYLIGRMVLTSKVDLIKSLEIFVVISLIATPFFLAEFFLSPFFYELLYGFHPFNHDGAERALNYRPMLLLEHGNQLGMWYSTAALAAFGLWKSGKQVLYTLNMNYVHLCLVLMLLLSQSRGAIVLYILGVVFTLIAEKVRPRVLALSLLSILAFVTLIPVFFGDQLYVFAKTTEVGQQLVSLIKEAGGRSLTWRVGQDLKNAVLIKENFLVGVGSINWSLDGEVRPWGAIMLILGGYGATGLLAWSALLVSPLLLVFKLMSASQASLREKQLMFVVANILVLNWLDAILNSFFIVVLIVWSGSIVTLAQVKVKKSLLQ